MSMKMAAAVRGSLLLLVSGGVFVACEHSMTAPATPPVAVQPTLSSIQANILTPNCAIAGCHAGGNPTGQLSLVAGSSYNALVGPAGTGVTSSGYAPRLRVSPGNSNNSVLYLKIIGNNAVGAQMPAGRPPLSPALADTVRKWIDTGALNN